MALRLDALCFEAQDPLGLARFWSGVLGQASSVGPRGGVTLRPTDAREFAISFVPSTRAKSGQNRMHLDLTSTSVEDQRRTVARSLDLGARHVDVGQRPEEGHVVLADPEGNEFCVVEPGNAFLADCGLVGAINCDGSQQVGYFWSEALGWPLVWDQDQETAIRSPHGGPKVTWSGPPLMPRTGRNRLHLDLACARVADRPAEIERLIPLGATRLDSARAEPGRDLLTDPDGNEFCVLTALQAYDEFGCGHAFT